MSFGYSEEDTLHEHPILTFSLPRSQVMAAPETVTRAPDFEPKVTNVGTVNAPKLHFDLPRAVKFYYGSLLGQKPVKHTLLPIHFSPIMELEITISMKPLGSFIK